MLPRIMFAVLPHHEITTTCSRKMKMKYEFYDDDRAPLGQFWKLTMWLRQATLLKKDL